MRHKRFDLSGRGVDLRNLPKLLGVSANVLGAWSAGHSRVGYLDDISGNGRHLAAGGTTPSITNSNILGVDGNPIRAHNFGGAGYFSLAHDPWMNVFDGDYTVVQLLKVPTVAPAGTITTFAHGVFNASGAYLSVSSGGYASMLVNKAGASVNAQSAASIVDGLYHVVCAVKNNGRVTLCVDNVYGAQVDGSDGYGLDASVAMYIGAYAPATNYYTQPIAYTLLLNAALSHQKITRAQHLLMGSCAGRSAGHYAVPTFQRASTSYCERKGGDRSLVQVPAGYPVQGPDGGQLIQGSVQNVLTYTGAFSTNWTKTRSSIAATSVLLPDGSAGTTNTLHEDGTVASTHPMTHAFSATTGVTYCWSLYVKYNPAAATPREWVLLSLVDSAKSSARYFNIRYGYTGSSIGSMVTRGHGIKPIGDGWYRVWVWGVSENTSAFGYVALHPGEADGDNAFDGLDQDSVFIAFPQLETNAFPTIPIPCPTTAVTRAADSETWIPWSVSKALLPCLSAAHQAQVKLHFTGSESLNAATATPTTGSYSFTKNGRPQNGYTEAEQDYFQCNGSTDSLSLASAGDFVPAGSFSVVFAYTPLSVAASTFPIMNKWNATGNQRGWQIYQNGTTIFFKRSTDGQAGTVQSVSVTSCLEVGKPVLVGASYSTTLGLYLRVDALAEQNTACTGTVHPLNTEPLYIAADGGNYLNGKLLQLLVLDHGVGGAVVSAAEHAALYAAWKQDGMIPLTMSATTPKTKLIVEFEAKGQFSSAGDVKVTKHFLFIGGITGGAALTKNSVGVKVGTDGAMYGEFYNDSDAIRRYIKSSARTDLNKWHKHVFTLDLGNTANSTYTIDGVLMTDASSMSGVGNTLSFVDSLVRIGQAVDNFAHAHSDIRAPKLYAE